MSNYEYIKKLERENENLRLKLQETRDSWAINIDTFVDEWFEENKEKIDVGVIDCGLFKIDVFPDTLEKHIYKKSLKIFYSFINAALTPKCSKEKN